MPCSGGGVSDFPVLGKVIHHITACFTANDDDMIVNTAVVHTGTHEKEYIFMAALLRSRRALQRVLPVLTATHDEAEDLDTISSRK